MTGAGPNAGGAQRAHENVHQSPGDRLTAPTLGELADLAAPAGADLARFAELKSALRAMLEARDGERVVAQAPTEETSRVDDLLVYSNGDGTATCAWTYRNTGDYNADSQVTVADLTPVGQYYQAVESGELWGLALCADGDTNGEVNIGDLTPLGRNLGCSVTGYHIESSLTGDPLAQWNSIGEVLFSASTADPAGGPRRFGFMLSAPQLNAYYRVVPYFESMPGLAGLITQYTAAPPARYSISGVCGDESGQPLSDVTLTLADGSSTISGMDGSFSLANLGPGELHQVTPSLGGLVFVPRQRYIVCESGAIGNADFCGFAIADLQHNLPHQAEAGTDISFQLTALDGTGNPASGFSTPAQLSAAPAGMSVQIQPVFSDGVATAVIRFSDTGLFDVSIAGLGVLDRSLGQVDVTPAQPPVLSVARWQGGAEAAISLTFDDGTKDHWERGLALWDEYGFKVTLGIMASRFESEPSRIPQLQQAFDAGHELANHTANHEDLTLMQDWQVRSELDICRNLLLGNVQGLTRVDTVIYPYAIFDDRSISILQSQGYLFARASTQDMTTQTAINDAYVPPFYHLYSWAPLSNLPAWAWDDTTDSVVASGGWFIEQCHGIGVLGEPGVGWSARLEADYRAHYDHIKSYGARIWVAPLGTVGRYVMERNAAQLLVLSYNNEGLALSLTDGLDDEVFDVPLTLEFHLPAAWRGANIKQGLISFSTVTKDRKLSFSCLPDAGTIMITAQF